MTGIGHLPPTTESLLEDETRPYFLWWTNLTNSEFRELLQSPDRSERAYWTGALLREANTRDVGLYLRRDDIRELWPDIIRYLGRSRSMWAWLLELPEPEWPPRVVLQADG